MSIIKMLTHPIIQDLAFIIESECIYQDFDLSPYWASDVADKLLQLNENPTPILVLLQQSKSHFLGSYFEHLLSYAIHHLSDLDVVFEHMQIIENKKTLGEIDILIRTPQGDVHQLELAIKFYLHTNLYLDDVSAINNEFTTLLGPNKNDSFRKKYTRAKQHQLTILDVPAAKALLNTYGIDGQVGRQLLMFGYLYSQFIDSMLLTQELSIPNNKALDPLVNPASMQGWWLYIKDIMCLYDGWLNARELAKLEWITDINSVTEQGESNHKNEENKLFTQFDLFHANIKTRFEQDKRPRHFIINFRVMGQVVCKRFFIVPNTW